MTREKAAMAVNAMKAIGVSEQSVTPVLKKLLKLYDKNWSLIEDENYRVLADAIFECQDIEVEQEKKSKEAPSHEELDGPPLKRLRLRKQGEASLSGATSFSKPNVEEANHALSYPCKERAEPLSSSHRGRIDEHEPISFCEKGKQKQPVSPHVLCSRDNMEPSQLHFGDKRLDHELTSPQTCSRGKGPIFSSQTSLRQETEHQSLAPFRDSTVESNAVLSQSHLRAEEMETGSGTAHRAKGSRRVCLKEPKVEPGILLVPKQKMLHPRENNGLMSPKTEPFADDYPPFEVPIAVMRPPSPGQTCNEDPVQKEACSTENYGETNGHEPLASEDKHDSVPDRACETGSSLELTNVTETPTSFEIASSPLGDVKISLSCNQASGRPDFQIPNLDAVLKAVEDKCLRSHKVLEPNFSLMKVMQEMCQCFLELGTESTNSTQESFVHITSDLNFLKKSSLRNAFGAKGDHQGNFRMPESLSAESLNLHSSDKLVSPGSPKTLLLNGPDSHLNESGSGSSSSERNTEANERNTEANDPNSNLRSLVIFQPQDSTVDEVRPIHDVYDISKGEERVSISLVNEVSSELYPPSFFYIPRNLSYQSAYVNVSLARIGDEDCCSNCFGNCLSSSIPCACARETGGEFAYTVEGLVKEKFLDECISMYRDPRPERHYYCKKCPLERFNDPCKGHLVRKFIKECWSKCGCSKRCGNRVVQRGIACSLQVFLTSEGKGWGLRTLQDLPRGTFVCEYVGEILTNTELYERNLRSTGNEKHTYPVLLDADWGSESSLKDEEALCLDATYYGNVARFINHRCYDATMVEIPVEVETPDRHYYHLAFFTTRDVYALEELTWDYGIDFKDHKHPVKAFRCFCGSKCCRDMKRSNRTKSKR
ncbi:hypothetical protein IFM89_010531 [Coptis chinensis]|uniref:Uncharacterized protein n=1 Tax=Coptis chinensis TaxID=261450 RepID=A0A835LZ81_9MAGN|nr:hypothetical protein IFM89_010531 [Coptis chinensis]